MNRSVPTRLLGVLCVFLLAVPLCGGSALARGDSRGYGTRFLIAFPDTLIPGGSVRSVDAAAIVIMADEPASVSVTAPGFARTVKAAPGASAVVMLNERSDPARYIYVTEPARSTRDVYTVTADRPVLVCCWYFGPGGSEGFAPLPVESWGIDYIAAGLSARTILDPLRSASKEEGFAERHAPAQLLLLADRDGTVITVRGGAFGSSGPRTISLDAGETYLLEPPETGSGNGDLSAARITADKPIGVLCGNTRSSFHGAPLPLRIPTFNSARNALLEWLAPVEPGDVTFVYAPLGDSVEVEDLIRIHALDTGTTMVSVSSILPPQKIPPGSFIELNTALWRSMRGSTPLALRADRPVQAVVVRGATAEEIPGDGVIDVRTWSSSMALLTPYARWIASGRFHAPGIVPAMKHELSIVADSGASIVLDGVDITSKCGRVDFTPFKYAAVTVAPGDHALRSIGGRFTATLHGRAFGYERVRALRRVKREGASTASNGNSGAPILLHPTEYGEELSYAYSLPVLGITPPPDDADSMKIEVVEECDSTVVSITSSGSPWRREQVDIALEPGADNVKLTLTPILSKKIVAGYRAVMRPESSERDAYGVLGVRGEVTGYERHIPFTRAAGALSVEPSHIALDDIVSNGISLALTNGGMRGVMIRGIFTRSGGVGIRTAEAGALPREIGPGERFDLALVVERDRLGAGDSLMILTDCRTIALEIRGDSPPPPPTAPKLWLTRLEVTELCVGRRLDTMVAIRNTGSARAVIDRITAIQSDPSIIWSLPSPPTVIEPGGTLALRVSIAPVKEGIIDARLIVESGGDTLTFAAAVRGTVSICSEAILQVDDHDFGTHWISTETGGTITLFNGGGSDAELLEMHVVDDANGAFSVDSLPLPRTIRAGGSLAVPCRYLPIEAGEHAGLVRFRAATGTLFSHLKGVGKRTTVAAEIRRDYHAAPGEEFIAYVELMRPDEEADPDTVRLTVGHDSRLLRLRDLAPAEGTTGVRIVDSSVEGDSIRFTVLLDERRLPDGRFIAMRFFTHLVDIETSAFPLRLISSRPYIDFVEIPGFFVRDPICGLENRLIDYTGYDYHIKGAVPNPVDGGATIDFEIAFEERTRIAVYDPLGSLRAVLIDTVLPPGRHSVPLPAGLLAAGAYTYVITSGSYIASQRMIVR